MMARLRLNRKPTFFWQALLIVLPVAVLAVVGMISLRQDKILAQHEAVERAQAIADDLTRRIWSKLTTAKAPDELRHRAFQIDSAGRLIYPPPVEPVPVPKPFDLAELDGSQAKLWRTAQTAEAEGDDVLAAIQCYGAFLDSNPPEKFVAAARYGLGLLLAKQGKDRAAAEMFESVLEKYPGAVGESGVPLASWLDGNWWN
jgi:TolA-binding protein